MHESFIQDGFGKCIEYLLQAAPFLTIFSSQDGDKLRLKNRVQVTVRVEWKELLESHILKKKQTSSQLHGMFPSQKPLHMMWDMRELFMIYLPKLYCIKVVYPTPGGEDPPLLSKYTVQPRMSQTGLRFYYSGWHSWQIAPGLRREWNHRMRQAQCYFMLFSFMLESWNSSFYVLSFCVELVGVGVLKWSKQCWM